jgi:hypothetical protein
MTGNRKIAWFGTLLGLTASTGANVLHAIDMDKGGTAAIVGAAFWPLALLASTETLTRTQWPGRVRPWAVGSVVLVAVVTAVVSYGHLRDLMDTWGAGPVERTIAPLAVDGLMTVCSLALTVAVTPVSEPVAETVDGPVTAPVTTPVVRTAVTGPVAEPCARPVTPRARSGSGADVSELLPIARKAAREAAESGARLTREGLRAAVRAHGHTLSTDRARLLLREVTA